ncbi:MAG: hypothetical protein JWN56_944 [Sphingobacteriales bacterium]|nr:hypothetical protein [Sphingobacteriales bacterium]
MVISLKNKHYKCFYPLFEATIQFSTEALLRIDKDVYCGLLFIYTNLYLTIYPHQYDESYKDFFPLTLRATANYEALLQELGLVKRRKPENIKLINEMGYHTYTHLCKLGYYVINNEDVERFKEIASMLDRDMFDVPDFTVQTSYYRLINDANVEEDQIKKVKIDYAQAFALKTYRRHTALALQSWIFHLKRKKRINDQNAAKMIKVIRVDYDTSREALNDILQIYQGKWLNYFDWQSWHLPPNEDETFVPDSINWLTFGFFVGQLINNQIQFILFEESLKNNGVLDILITQFKQFKIELSNDFKNWQELLYVIETNDELNIRADAVIRVFERLTETLALKNLREVAEQPLDLKLVEQFADQSLETWKKEAHIWQLLCDVDAICQSSDEKLPFIGRNGYERNLKQFFLEYNQHNDVNILRPIVGQEGRESDTSMLLTIREQAPVFREGALTDVISEGLQQLRNAGLSPDAIIVSPGQSFANDLLMQHPLFKASHEEHKYDFKIGEFDAVSVYFSHSHAIQDYVAIVCMKTAFEFEYLTSPTFKGSFLNISVEEISKEEALAVEKVQVHVSVEASEKFELALRNGIRLTVGINGKLKIKDLKALKVGRLL